MGYHRQCHKRARILHDNESSTPHYFVRSLRSGHDGEDRERLRWLTKELGIEMRVVFAGGRANDKVPELLRIADIFVRASRSEGQGISFLEAMVSGVPTIGTPVGGIPAFLTEETGWLCQPGVPESITDAIRRILAPPKAVLDQKLANTVEFVRKNYDWKTITEEMRALFDRVANARRILIVTGIYPPDIGG
ncbi:MAG TPA: glycosyltransferase family 4 protein, partial [Promineifilum sp.]|nr:glycosyltransferase family 4 protein [Promineifilum sp.]